MSWQGHGRYPLGNFFPRIQGTSWNAHIRRDVRNKKKWVYELHHIEKEPFAHVISGQFERKRDAIDNAFAYVKTGRTRYLEQLSKK